MEELNLQTYWDGIYEKNEVEKLGWYEENPEQSLLLIEKCGLNKNARILNIGTGASTLIDKLLENKYENVIASDISSSSLSKLKARLGDEKSKRVEWIVDDLTKPEKLTKIQKVDLWHDRAVLHFLTEEQHQKIYFKLLHNLVKKEGFVIIASFNMDGATMCSGLPVYRYNRKEISKNLGNKFILIDDFNYTYTMPSGTPREYIYTLFKRI